MSDNDIEARRALEKQIGEANPESNCIHTQQNIIKHSDIIVPPPDFYSTEHIELIGKHKLQGTKSNSFEVIFPVFSLHQRNNKEDFKATSPEFIFYFLSENWFWTIASVLAIDNIENIVKDCYRKRFNEIQDQDIPIIIEIKNCIGNPCDWDDGTCDKPGLRIWSLKFDLEMDIEIFKQILEGLSFLAQLLEEEGDKLKGFRLDDYQDAMEFLRY
ncbi:MAG TPA: hypothetical protein PKX30_01920 [Candidatus Pacearchaeota archaeon]|nr:hypothetical protein [Candidatus Pacearchaeota archaeon]